GDRCRDVAVAGENHAAGVRAALLQALDHVEAVAVPEPHVDHCEGRSLALDGGETVRDALGEADMVPAAFHGPGEATREGAVIVHDQETLVGARLQPPGRVGHQNISLRHGTLLSKTGQHVRGRTRYGRKSYIGTVFLFVRGAPGTPCGMIAAPRSNAWRGQT